MACAARLSPMGAAMAVPTPKNSSSAMAPMPAYPEDSARVEAGR